jgi:cysteinyl-tRNA synthetase
LKSDLSNEDKLATILDFDKVLGLDLGKNNQPESELVIVELPEEVQVLIKERELARSDEDWQKSDELRDQIQEQGYLIKDTQDGTEVFRK